MIVVITGGYRTGSTIAYIVAQALLEAAGVPYEFAGANADTLVETLERPREAETLLLKSHDLRLEPGADRRILLCYRNPYDMVASRMRLGVSSKQALAELHVSRGVEGWYKGRADVCHLDYDTLYPLPQLRVDTIASFLGLAVSTAKRERICRDTSVERMKAVSDVLEQADSRTELRPRHVGPALGRPGSYTLPADVREQVDAIVRSAA